MSKISQDLTDKKIKEKFFFNRHIFDEGHIEEEEPPPPPVFSEEDLESAKTQAFNDGLKQGHDEATKQEKESRAESISKTLQKIAAQTSILFEEEEKRGQNYEEDSIALSLKTFEALFPLYQEKYGFDELKQHIKSVLEKHNKKQKISVHVSEESKAGVQKLLSELSARGHNGEFEVCADTSLLDGACRIGWPQGGAEHDKNALAQEITTIMQQPLAGTKTKGHDKENDAIIENDLEIKDDAPAAQISDVDEDKQPDGGSQ